ncbi:MAG: AMP-binding protein, partial [Alphaproteobacteria bacterium]|nr:AMP-binding protein [Alphaproteobacteria bacterium]
MPNEPLYQGCSYADLIIRAIQRSPERQALIDRRETVSYRQLADRISRVGQALTDLGMRKGDGLSQLAANRIDAVVVYLACATFGIRYTPLHPMGAVEDQAFILADAEISTLVVDADGFAEKGRELAERVPELGHVLTLGPADFGQDLLALAADHEPLPLVAVPSESDLAWVAYTGGTTGRPKGVMLPHRAMVMNVLITLAEWRWPADIRLLVATPVTHAAGALIVPTMLRGGTVVIQPGFEPTAFLAAVEEYRITASFLV